MMTVVKTLRRMIGRTDPLVVITRIVIVIRDVTETRDPDEATAQRMTVTGMEAKHRQANEMTVLSTSVVKVRSVIGDGTVCCKERNKVFYGRLYVV